MTQGKTFFSISASLNVLSERKINPRTAVHLLTQTAIWIVTQQGESEREREMNQRCKGCGWRSQAHWPRSIADITEREREREREVVLLLPSSPGFTDSLLLLYTWSEGKYRGPLILILGGRKKSKASSKEGSD